MVYSKSNFGPRINYEFHTSALTIEQIFSEDHSWTATLSAERKRVIVVTGDVNPARSVNAYAVKTNNYTWPYENTASILGDADISFINLETPLLKNCPVTTEGMTFCGSERNVEGLIFAGIDVVSIANNHAENFGLDGVLSTTKILENNGILVAGRDKSVYKNIRGINFAFLGYSDFGRTQGGILEADETKIQNDISQAQKHAHIVIVMFHWGTEYINQPNERQISLGKFAIDVGADLVVGNHPHWIQPVEIYKDKIIAYSHGNFVFDQFWSKKTREGVVGKYSFYDNKLIDVEYMPVSIDKGGQPFFISDPAEKKRILDEMQTNSMQRINSD